MEKVFVDAAAFIALLAADDNYHSMALETQKNLINTRAILITTNHIIDEVATWFVRYGKTGHHLAADFGAYLQQDPLVHHITLPAKIPASTHLAIIYSTPVVEQVAWSIFSKYDTTGFSFTDCVSFATMQALGIKKAFTFDTHFDVMGFERV